MSYRIRKWYCAVEEIRHEGGEDNSTPLKKVVAAVVLLNPYAGLHRANLDALSHPSAELGSELARRALALMAGRGVESYGKGAIAGVGGEQEHAVACITTVFGDAIRAAVGGGKAWICSNTKVGSAGEPIDLPLAHKDALYVRSHYDTITLRIPDAPRPDELVVAIALSSGARIHQRVGGLTAAQAIKGDGLR